jgi:hypothetical protein
MNKIEEEKNLILIKFVIYLSLAFLCVIFALLDPDPQHWLGPRKGQPTKAHFSPFHPSFEKRHGILNQPALLGKV